ncbi:hypothetical protein P0D68_32425 [Paraburkholderia sp. RL17-380-BIE-A]|uniref:hypothetical protein n=1 Tax=Paraburkholderia sp. RL17-380-BIE-A TaxID=3031630 RepID=UPI0038BA936C
MRKRSATSSADRPLAVLCKRWSASSGESPAISLSVSLLVADPCAPAGDGERRSQVLKKGIMVRIPYLPSRSIMAWSIDS